MKKLKTASCAGSPMRISLTILTSAVVGGTVVVEVVGTGVVVLVVVG